MLKNFFKKNNAKIYNILVWYIFNKEFKALAEKYIKKGKLVDIGCGAKPYKTFFKDKVSEHVGIDHQDCLHSKDNIDIIGSAYEIPVENAYFDNAICTAVLEHLEEPDKAIKEAYRVLKKEGIAIYSAPFIWHLHEEPRDFYRYSKYGLRYLFEKNNFEVLENIVLSGFWVTFGQLFVYYLNRFNKGIIRAIGILTLILLIIQLVAYVLDKIDKAERWTWMNIIVVKKVK